MCISRSTSVNLHPTVQIVTEILCEMSEVRDEVLGVACAALTESPKNPDSTKHTAAINTLLFVCFVLSGFCCCLL